ncbi:hypothetical protein [Nocardioides jiangxiensis]|uniref:JAB domain-containing protein n=1 Tax=Nocardioides jiangxiensis TaxID=3064524 RepID=A0ABT9B1B2_9ACTN|nr:hypothetical protein [Nocardioides sp. WY-20]MDO7868525.1 hypothetical protein [Nocardioides sp. WY-20]
MVMSRSMWRGLLAELQRRGEEWRESGAFLLARPGESVVEHVAYYDDLDANCLTGGITFASAGFTRLWELCATRGLRVVADIHTHPGEWVGQSRIDETNPMISTPGHIALIAPEYGRRTNLEEFGVHVYQGGHRWTEVLPGNRRTVVRVVPSVALLAYHALRLVRGWRR